MPAIQDISGQRFGRLVAIKIDHRKPPTTFWLCRCDCGNTNIVAVAKLKNGHCTSCGCSQREAISSRMTTHGLTKGNEKSPEFNTWCHMKTRCLNKRCKSYPDYGGRGITICDRWLGPNGFPNFLADMGPKPKGGRYSIGRIDNDGNYEPGNCRWESDLEQAHNKRNSQKFTYNGRTLCISEWCREVGGDDSIIHMRLRRGWSIERAVSTPAIKRQRPETNQAAAEE